jgi:hypothetical protein
LPGIYREKEIRNLSPEFTKEENSGQGEGYE